MEKLPWNLGRKGLVLGLIGLITLVSLVLMGSRSAQVRLFQSTATCQFSSVPYETGFPDEPQVYGSAYFLLLEFEVVRSQMILDPVIHQLDLTSQLAGRFNRGQKLTPDQAREVLLRRLKVSLPPGLNSHKLEVTVASEQPNEASTIANAIVLRYQNYRRETLQQRYLWSIQQIEQKITLARTNPQEFAKSLRGRPSIEQQQAYLQELVRKLESFREESASPVEVVKILQSATPAAERRWWRLERSWFSEIASQLSEGLGIGDSFTPP
ncbi:MAG: hypothetical protein J0M24_14115 [Verrucomicrobia bacterium]|nr:hypothetical protein [Verrucomicrobiota bacterium]